MNGVPGVIALLSHVFLFSASSSTSPSERDFSILRNSALSSSFSLASCADRNLRERCWFILARGATPSIEQVTIINNFLGRTILTTLSVYLKISIIISSSLAGAGRSSGCAHGWTMPFMSRYRLSNSSPLGFRSRVSIGIFTPSTSSGSFSMTGEMILGYFVDNHLNNAGTPMLKDRVRF
ncbi:hypothetical protein M501DRAFT_971962 [Patellaria atrata CBS 101060]|uniref:Secreted protein n=1 Tax=Patellaria atrata CBS 101060 TaxID=1346257 RepID=A0A9P4SCI6_9PEZI|nr:hypothetical protein M501DRAFT_971962 [Patellaria atrata CBS 101060]